MSARDDDSWLFVAEWFDPMPRLKRMYLLKYFTQQHAVEMVDVKSKKMFLKKSPCPAEVTAEDFGVGKKVFLYSRELDIIDYGDLKTKQVLQHQHQQTVVVLGPDLYQQWGTLLDALNQPLALVAAKSVYPSVDVAARICQAAELPGNNRSYADALSKGVCLVLLMSGAAAPETAAAVLKQQGVASAPSSSSSSSSSASSSSAAIATQTGVQTSELADVVFTGARSGGKSVPNSSTLDSCTCCVVKPHAVKARATGKVLDAIIQAGYEVSALATLTLDRIQAEEFLEVYKDVVPDYGDHVVQMSAGLAVALELRAEDAVTVFRETAGPWDVEIAKELRPQSLRGTFGETNVRSAVHCTDLPTDGVSECEYCFRIMNS
jgi:nucleoside-diphosphate kinase